MIMMMIVIMLIIIIITIMAVVTRDLTLVKGFNRGKKDVKKTLP